MLLKWQKYASNNNINKVEWLQSDWFSNVENRYDLIVSNPPYISNDHFQNLTPEIKDYEPAIALTDNSNGFRFLDQIISQSPAYLRNNGYLILEISYDQVDGVKQIFNKAGYINIGFESDFSGHDRFVVAQISK